MKRFIFLPTITVLVLTVSIQAQNTGIGTLTPTRAKLEVIGVYTGGATGGLFGSNNAGISLQRNWPTIGFNQYRDLITFGSQGKYMSNGYAALQFFDPGAGILYIDLFPSGTANGSTPGGTRAITVGNNGNTGIRTDHLGATLVVGRGDGAEGSAVFQGPTHASHFHHSVGENTYIRAGQNGATVFINREAGGPVLIGSTSSKLGINNPNVNPFYTIEINHTQNQFAFTLVDALPRRWSMKLGRENTVLYGSGTYFNLYYQGSFRTSVLFFNGAIATISDRNLKKDIQPFESVLSKVNQLRPVRYEMIRNNPEHRKSIGLLAQDVRPLFPELVHTVVDHNRSGAPINDALVMDYSGFGIIAIKALQEQAQQLNALKKEKEQLLQLLEELELATVKSNR